MSADMLLLISSDSYAGSDDQSASLDDYRELWTAMNYTEV